MSVQIYELAGPGGDVGLAAMPASHWLDRSLVPEPERCYPYVRDTSLPPCPKWRSLSSRADAVQYARRFFHAAARGGRRHPAGSPLRGVFADAARLYVKAHTDAVDLEIPLADTIALLGEADQRNATALAIERRGTSSGRGGHSTPSSPGGPAASGAGGGLVHEKAGLSGGAWVGIAAAGIVVTGLLYSALSAPSEELVIDESEEIGHVRVPCGCR